MAVGAIKDESDLKRWLERHETNAPGSKAQTVLSLEGGLRLIRGTVNTAGSGSIVAGSGFNLTRNGAGDVTINFTAPFSAAPTVTVSPVDGSNVRLAQVVTHAVGSSQLWHLSTAFALVDGVLDFHAIGPA